jgi:hypothetical protein
MGILRTNKISGLGTDGTVFQGVTKFDTQGYFVSPSGTTDQRNAGITTTDGTIRFNTDSQKLEFYAQSQWWEMVIDTPNLAVGSNTDAGARGVFAGGRTAPSSPQSTIFYINTASTGNAVSFGSLSGNYSVRGTCASSTRGIWSGGYSPSPGSSPYGRVNVIEYVTISSTGNTTDFGDTATKRQSQSGVSNQTRGVFTSGYEIDLSPAYRNTFDYITIATTGNSINFGNISSGAAAYAPGAFASPTRGVFGGGEGVPAVVNTIHFVTISTLGNSQDFGDLSSARICGGCSNATRGVFFSGYVAPTYTNTIEYVTIATTGNATKFGDLTQIRGEYGALSSSTRGICIGGYAPSVPSPNATNVIDYILFTTQGNAVDFGDLTTAAFNSDGFSNAHGGL